MEKLTKLLLANSNFLCRYSKETKSTTTHSCWKLELNHQISKNVWAKLKVWSRKLTPLGCVYVKVMMQFTDVLLPLTFKKNIENNIGAESGLSRDTCGCWSWDGTWVLSDGTLSGALTVWKSGNWVSNLDYNQHVCTTCMKVNESNLSGDLKKGGLQPTSGICWRSLQSRREEELRSVSSSPGGLTLMHPPAGRSLTAPPQVSPSPESPDLSWRLSGSPLLPCPPVSSSECCWSAHPTPWIKPDLSGGWSHLWCSAYVCDAVILLRSSVFLIHTSALN